MKHILIIYTGGTIGMQIDSQLGVLVPFSLSVLWQNIPELTKVNAEIAAISIESPIDSANATAETWQDIGDSIFKHQDKYDAFIVLHGTDTMAYSATACSFMFRGFKKPIIFTGSQLPISNPNTDAKRNILGAINFLVTANRNNKFREVGIYFNQKLFRAVRTTKIHASSFEGFGSPNSKVLADVNEIYANRYLNSDIPFRYQNKFLDCGIRIIKWHPLITKEELETLIHVKLNVLIIESYGTGTLPAYDWLISKLSEFVKNGGIIINKTQSYQGKVEQGIYETSATLAKMGIIPAKDMTIEAIIVKAAWLYIQKPNVLEFKHAFLKDYCGEME